MGPQIDSFSEVILKFQADPILPNANERLSAQSDQYTVSDGITGDWSKIVANSKGFYVLHPVQTKSEEDIFDPYTIGQVIGYLYEVNWDAYLGAYLPALFSGSRIWRKEAAKWKVHD